MLGEAGALGAGADQAHVAAEDVEELRQLVDALGADEGTDAGDAGVSFGGPAGTGGLGIDPHAAELQQREDLAVQADALLAIHHRAARLELDQAGDQEAEG